MTDVICTTGTASALGGCRRPRIVAPSTRVAALPKGRPLERTLPDVPDVMRQLGGTSWRDFMAPV